MKTKTLLLLQSTHPVPGLFPKVSLSLPDVLGRGFSTIIPRSSSSKSIFANLKWKEKSYRCNWSSRNVHAVSALFYFHILLCTCFRRGYSFLTCDCYSDLSLSLLQPRTQYRIMFEYYLIATKFISYFSGSRLMWSHTMLSLN